MSDNCQKRQIDHKFRIQQLVQQIYQLNQQLMGLAGEIERLGYDHTILMANSCCGDPDCPDCHDYPEKPQLKDRCNVTVDLRRDCV